MNIKAVLLFVMAFPCLSFAQNLVTGKVVDGTTLRPLSGAHLYKLSENNGVVSDQNGNYQILCKSSICKIKCLYPGYKPLTLSVPNSGILDFKLTPDKPKPVQMDTVITFDPETYEEQIMVIQHDATSNYNQNKNKQQYSFLHDMNPNMRHDQATPQHNTDDFSTIYENRERLVTDEPLSTFSIDVDRASYSILRNAINNNWDIPENAVRLEEMINYFEYDYPQPKKGEPFSINSELSDCPWNPDRKLLHIGLQGKDIDFGQLPPSNLVFFIRRFWFNEIG